MNPTTCKNSIAKYTDTENNDNEAGNSNSTNDETNSGRWQAFSDGDCTTSSNVDTQNNQGVEFESETEYESTDSNDSDIVRAPVASIFVEALLDLDDMLVFVVVVVLDKEEIFSLRTKKIQLAMLQMK